MFIRIKRIKGGEYAYLVKNKWTSKGPRQKNIKYLGKCLTFQRTRDSNLTEFLRIKSLEQYIEKSSLSAIFDDLIRLELFNHDFTNSSNKWVKEDIVVNLKSHFCLLGKKNIVLKLNEGFLCRQTMLKLLKFKPEEGLHEEEIALKLANTLLGTGLKVEKRVFVGLCNKLFKLI